MSCDGSESPELLPILESGDRLSCQEFERRYHHMPQLKKAELVEGIVYLPSPLRYYQHGKSHSQMVAWLEIYAAATPGLEVADNATIRLDSKNEPQPDVLLRLDENLGGNSRISEDDYVEGAPELIVEIAGSSASYDLHDKKQAYHRNGVREYLVWLVAENKFRWYVWESPGYRQQVPDDVGIVTDPALKRRGLGTARFP
ncbi:Uma2 family endonuclease [Geitlerinema sp. PCC 9228]|jgi:Uma2 family endonuclease|uniref:Uma2 family endonuclease n=1 Tax=Geitlerinema sp. PCC 9228 TaxID=111611 RepID=UPI000A003A4C|nr:Uma2 family endonuclease [Geitlerinema sp. PCC 9228]